jgi:hypothetical protein
MDDAYRHTSATQETYEEWLHVQKASVALYYTKLVNVSQQNYVNGNCGLDAHTMSQKILKPLNEYVAVTIIQLEKLMRGYKRHDPSFTLSITNAIDKLISVVCNSTKTFIPAKLRNNIMYLCYILPSEYFDQKKDEGNVLLQEALKHIKTELHRKTYNAYLHANGGGIKLLLEGDVPSPASQCDVNPYVI